MIDVNMEYSASRGWTFIVPRPLTPKALERAKFNVKSFYEKMITDFEAMNPADPVLPDLHRCVEHLECDKVRVIVDKTVRTSVEDDKIIVSGGGL